jgi:hypothetical protein
VLHEASLSSVDVGGERWTTMDGWLRRLDDFRERLDRVMRRHVEIGTRHADGLTCGPVEARAAIIAVPLGVLKAAPDDRGAIAFVPELRQKQEALEDPAAPAVPHGRCCVRSEPEDDRRARAAEIELGVPERQPQDVEILERVKISDIPSYADVLGRKDHQAPADVPAKMIVIALEERGNVEVDMAFDQPEARRKVGLRRPNLRSEQHVTHDGKNARRVARRRPKKIPGVRDVKLEADDWAQRAETNTDIQLLVLAPGNLRTP